MTDGERVRRVVVLGTGTAVGKTWVTEGLAAALRELGTFVKALKPIETGVRLNAGPAEGEHAVAVPSRTIEASSADHATASDAMRLALVSSVPPGPAPYRFADPVSPHLAARRVGTSIELSTALGYIQQEETDMASSVLSCRVILVETAGGCFSPLGANARNVELALALEPALWVLVAPDALGVLHDVAAAVTALRAVARAPDFLVLSAARPADASTGTNALELATLGIAEPIACAATGDRSSLLPLARRLIA